MRSSDFESIKPSVKSTYISANVGSKQHAKIVTFASTKRTASAHSNISADINSFNNAEYSSFN
jgi:hypothetical protein